MSTAKYALGGAPSARLNIAVKAEGES